MTELSIGRRQLYILPTRIGWYFMMMLIAIFAIAVKFSNQAAFLMLFMLASIGMLAMLYTHNNVIGLRLTSHSVKPIFLGESALFNISVHNHSDRQRSALWLACENFHASLSIAPHQSEAIEISIPSEQRGYLSCPRVNLTSQYPIGIFFCWSKAFEPSGQCLVYPKPIDLLPASFTESDSSDTSEKVDRQYRGEDYSGMKAYQAGDRLRDVHWPSLAKTQKLVTVQYESHVSQSLKLSWFALPASLNNEEKLSQLCYWLLAAEKQQRHYQLEMPGQTSAFANGPAHLHECLTVLALWPKDSATVASQA